ncbi:MAG TPA: protein kinase [Ktedonobacterales bacterium]|nr:protein kinase [Ktedonobacterales bacterium]
MADLVGQTLGNYRVESRLGSGGMGEVYRATHVHLNRPAAIKVLHANQAADPTFQARFLREARAAAALSHPNIVEVFDFGEQDGASYLVMELIPDGSLRSLLRQRATSQGWSLGLGVDLVRQAAEGLGYAHAHGMVHRDIKPDNLLLQRREGAGRGAETERYQLKISDFGLARLMEDTGELTQTGVVMGTPAYMSPEQCQGGTLDGRSDLYSLGVVLYEVATGAPPFRVRTLSEAVFKHISAPPIPPREVFPDLPLALEDVIMRCLAKRPEDRFATGGELAEALDGALGDTEMRTIVPTISATVPPTPAPTPVQRASDANAPTVAATPPPAAAAPPAPTPPVVEAAAASAPADYESTISASRMPATPTPVQPRAVAESVAAPGVKPAPPSLTPSMVTPIAPPAARRWPGASDQSASAPATSGFPALLASIPSSRPWKLGLGGGALALIVILIVTLASGNHGAQKSAVNGAPSVGHTATAHASASPTPSPTPAGTVIYQAPLTSATRSWPNSSHSYFADGGYELRGAWIAYTPSPSVGDGLISVRLRQLSGPADQFYGLLFRGANDNLYYFYGISGSQQWTFSLVTNGNGKPIVAPTADSHITAGLNANDTIAVRATGGHFVFYVNGAQVGQADDATISSGRVGLINTVGNLAVVYNDFTVTGPA